MATNHSSMVQELADTFGPVLESSPDGVYLWVDEANKVCNKKLASMFGYSVEQWQRVQPFLDSFVAPEDREIFSWHYQNQVAALTHPATFRFRGVRKDGTTFAAETDMIPISWQGHPVAYHFVRELAE